MSILIKGMEMPNYCYECPFHSKIYNGIESQWWCSLLNKIAHDDEGHKTKKCPLVEVPDTQTEKKSLNGDVIGRQAAIDEIDEWIKAFLENGHKETAADAQLIQDGIIQLPSAQPEIIRCNDCMHNGSFDTDCPIDWAGKEYCNFAERRTDEWMGNS